MRAKEVHSRQELESRAETAYMYHMSVVAVVEGIGGRTSRNKKFSAPLISWMDI